MEQTVERAAVLSQCRYEGQISQQNLTINSVSRYLGLSPKLPHGWGEMKYVNEERYRGQWVGGTREGCGEIISPGSLATTFSGHWLQDKQTGWGQINYSNGAAFKGNWVRLDVSFSHSRPFHICQTFTNKNISFPLIKILSPLPPPSPQL